MAVKKESGHAFRQFPCGLQDHPKWLKLSSTADHMIRTLITDELLSTPIPGVCVRASVALIGCAMRVEDKAAIEAALSELEELGIADVDWDAMLIYIPEALRKSSAPRTMRALKAWERTWRRLPACDLRDRVEADVREMLAGQKAKVAHAFEVMCGKVAPPEPRVAQKRGPKPGAKRERKLEEISRINSEKKDQNNSEIIQNNSKKLEVSSDKFRETPINSEKLRETPEKFSSVAANSNDFNDLDSLFPTQNLDEIWPEKCDEIRDLKSDSGDLRNPSPDREVGLVKTTVKNREESASPPTSPPEAQENEPKGPAKPRDVLAEQYTEPTQAEREACRRICGAINDARSRVDHHLAPQSLTGAHEKRIARLLRAGNTEAAVMSAIEFQEARALSNGKAQYLSIEAVNEHWLKRVGEWITAEQSAKSGPKNERNYGHQDSTEKMREIGRQLIAQNPKFAQYAVADERHDVANMPGDCAIGI